MIALNAVPIFVLVAVFNNTFLDHERGPEAAHGHARRVFHRLGERRQRLAEVHPTQLELMRSDAASEVAILRKVRVPNAVPYLFIALKIAVLVAVITAFVSEYFGGSQNGLGSRIVASIAISKNATAWAHPGCVPAGLKCLTSSRRRWNAWPLPVGVGARRRDGA